MKLAGEREPGAMAAILALETAVVHNSAPRPAKKPVGLFRLLMITAPARSSFPAIKMRWRGRWHWRKEAGARKVVQLPITIAAHSPLMASVAAEFALAVDETPIQAPQIPVIGNVSARPLTTGRLFALKLKAQLDFPRCLDGFN